MNYTEYNEDIFNQAKSQHGSLERRLKMLLRKPYLTAQEELEIKILKKRKLYCKDIMEKTGHTH